MARRTDRDDRDVGRFIEKFAAVLTESGWPRMPSRVFGALLVSDTGRLTAAELADVLQASPAAISGAVQYLVPLSLVSREREPGSRRDVYVIHDNQWHEATLRSDQMLGRWERSLREGLEVLGRDTPAGRRIGQSLAFTQFVQEEVQGMLERWRLRAAELERNGP
jgi:DNA-binding transcriptional regulator GbsR (MarR family)